VRFLIDECLFPTLAALLRDHGHDAVHLVDLDSCGAPDTVVMRLAREQRRILVSADTDFGELLAMSNDVTPSVVLFRGSEVDAKILTTILLANLEQLHDALITGAIVVILDDRIRVRPLPVRSVPGD
jgi:predicted nuclease of predicted toxin-antitoxin system